MFLSCLWCACVSVCMCSCACVWCDCVYICVYALMCVSVMCLCGCVCTHVHVWYAYLCKYVCAYTHMWKSEAEASCLLPSFFTLFSWDRVSHWTRHSAGLDGQGTTLIASLSPNSGVRGMCSHEVRWNSNSNPRAPDCFESLRFDPRFTFLGNILQLFTCLFKNTFMEIKFPSQTIHPILSCYSVGFVLFRLVQPK